MSGCMLVYKEMPSTINRKVVLTPLERSWFSGKSDIRSFLLRSHSEEVADIVKIITRVLAEMLILCI